MITQAYLKEILRYDPSSGEWIWLVSRGCVRAGSSAGSVNGDGYMQIKIDRRAYTASRLAVLYMTGEFPPHDVDHENRDRGDERWLNLRLATRRQNMGNRPRNRNNTSGLKGVYWCSQAQRWRATISINGRPRVLGNFRDKEAAGAAYQRAAAEVFGDFANSG